MHNPLHRWSQLRSSDRGDGVVEIPTLDSGIDTGFGVVRYAIGLKGEPRLLVPTSGYHPVGLTSTSKLSISIVSLAVAGKSVRFIDIMCLEKNAECSVCGAGGGNSQTPGKRRLASHGSRNRDS